MRFVIALLIALSLRGQGSIQRDRTDSKDQLTKQKKNPGDSPKGSALPGATNTVSVNEPPANPNKNAAQAQPEQVWKKAFAPEIWSNWAMVLITIFGFYFALRSLKAVEKQADAATRSTEALIETERPWVVITNIDPPPLAAPVSPSDVPTGFSFEFQNRGRTAARVVGVWARFHVTQDVLSLPNPPDYLDMEPDIEPEGQKVLTPGDPPYRLKRQFESGFFSETLIQAIRNQDLFLICYVLLKYTDFAGRDHDLQVCYGYVMPETVNYMRLSEGWRIAGPPGYNRTT
jgi:hypothetical protein